MRTTLSSLAILSTLASAACTDLQSADLKTAGMSAYMTVQADDSGQTTATAQLNVDDNATDFVTLSSGDTLVTTENGVSQTMTEDDALNDVTYSTTFQNAQASGTQYTIALNRTGSGNISAPNSTCTLPSPFTIAAPENGASFSRASSSITVNYGAGGSSDTLSYQLSGNCIQSPTTQQLNGDPGSFTIAAGSIQPVGPSQSAASCQVTLSVYRTRIGTLDSNYGSGGSIQCIQSRSVTIQSTP
jgi:hypothetical protein